MQRGLSGLKKGIKGNIRWGLDINSHKMQHNHVNVVNVCFCKPFTCCEVTVLYGVKLHVLFYFVTMLCLWSGKFCLGFRKDHVLTWNTRFGYKKKKKKNIAGKLSQSFLRNIKWCHAYKCWNAVLALQPSHLASVALLGNICFSSWELGDVTLTSAHYFYKLRLIGHCWAMMI